MGVKIGFSSTLADEEEPAFGRNPSSTTAAEEGRTEAEVEEEDHREQERLDEDKEEEEEHEEHRSPRKLAGARLEGRSEADNPSSVCVWSGNLFYFLDFSGPQKGPAERGHIK